MKKKFMTILIKLLFTSILLLPLNGYSQQEQPINEINEERFSNNNLKYQVEYINGIKQGKEIFLYESGSKKIESHFKNGKENGLWQQWYENGQIRSSVKFINGQKDGEEIYFNRDGSIRSTDLYKMGKIIK